VQQFFPVKELDIRQHDSLPDISAWKAFEEKLSPGTFRDEIRLGRIQVQYLDGQEEEALDELREWFAKMEPIQSTVLAASLCLPEGLEKVSEKDMKFMFIIELVASADKETYMEARREAHKHYMAMRRAFDKVVRPYNTLPKRKLREKSEFE